MEATACSNGGIDSSSAGEHGRTERACPDWELTPTVTKSVYGVRERPYGRLTPLVIYGKNPGFKRANGWVPANRIHYEYNVFRSHTQ